ncbi:MAG: polysaccharide biosynthesis/export protein [Verrucomicrobiota bacterium]
MNTREMRVQSPGRGDKCRESRDRQWLRVWPLSGLLLLLASSALLAGESPFADISTLTNPPAPVSRSKAAETAGAQTNTGTQSNPWSLSTRLNSIAETVTNAMDALDENHRLAIGDRLSFRIVEDEEDPKPLFVTDSGDLELPYLGRFPAAGRSCKELARAIKTELEKEYYYQATVIIAVDLMAKSRGKVYLVGPVRAPGPQEIPSDEILTLSKAILRAGGFSDFADKRNVRVTRKGEGPAGGDRTYTVNLAEILDQGKSAGDLPLEPGDLVYIPEKLIRF